MASFTPVTSVLVTVYNRASFLEQTLESIITSTFGDFEAIVVDDGSEDCSVEIAKQFAAKDNRIHVHTNERNLGDYHNRMKAASLAKGRYLKFVDSDDLIYPHSLAIMVDSMEKYPDAALALSHSEPEDDSPYPWCLSPQQAYHKHFLERGCLSCGPSGAIIRREAFEAVNGFNPQWAVLSDSDLWFRLAARWPTILLPPGLVWWRRHEEQEFTRNNADLFYLQKRYELTCQTLGKDECPLESGDRSDALNRSRQHLSRQLISLAFRGRRVRAALKIFQETDLSPVDLLRGLRPYQ